MPEALWVALISSTATLLAAVGGWFFAYRLNSQSKQLAQREKRIVKLEQEVRARIALEKMACEWLGELENKTPRAIQLELRNRTQAQTGLRPRLAPADVAVTADTPSANG